VNLPGTSWNAATHRITFASDHVDGPDEIFTSDPDGRNLARVTHHSSGGPYIEPSFSPDGKQIVFERDLSDTKAELWITGADGAGLRRLTMGSDDREPNWSPDGSKILFQRRTADWAIYTINPDGTGVFQVTPSAWSSTDASWSPDSKRIVYSAGNSTIAGANIFVIGALGGAPTRVTTSGGYDGAVSWSPDGQWLAFESSSNPSGEAVTRIMKVRAPPIE
jgi:TolB protein